jgi:negative regulator of flagellin synthesis FlgM
VKIENPIGMMTSTTLLGTVAQARQPVDAVEPFKTSGTKVQLSQQMKELEEKMSLQSGSSTFDSQKVQAIREAITEGRFHINPSNVVNGLLTSVQALMRNSPLLGTETKHE